MNFRVEFCGVPASGKSRLSSGTVQLLKKRGHEILDREAVVEAGLRKRDFGLVGGLLGACMQKWRRDFLGISHSLNDWHHFVVNNPGYAALVHGWLANSTADAHWRSCVFYSLLTTAFEFRMSDALRSPMVFDESFAQRFYTLRGYCGVGRPEDAARYAEMMPLPTILISVSAAPETCLLRLKQRAHLPVLLQHEPESVLLDRIREGIELLAHLATELERRGVVVLRVVGEQDPEPLTERIADCIGLQIQSR